MPIKKTTKNTIIFINKLKYLYLATCYILRDLFGTYERKFLKYKKRSTNNAKK